MKKTFTLISRSLLFLLPLSGSVLQAQTNKCGTPSAHNETTLEQKQFVEEFIKQAKQANASGRVSSAPKITIPVVVHILYHTAAQNISDAQVLSQIAALNRDFRKLNADASTIPPVFQPLAADCEIEFCLAQRTPNGAVTNGIIRKSTTVDDGYYESKTPYIKSVCHTNSGGDDAWDASQYLNIWVADLREGIHGITYPFNSAEDGVIIRTTCFGTTGNLEPIWTEGRITVHEVGHYLGLNHIFSGVTACTSSGDGVDDTPPQISAIYGCPTNMPNSCHTDVPDMPDMYVNYMDYSDDACVTMFTLGQKARMYSFFEPGQIRTSLKTSLGCYPPPCNNDFNEPNDVQANAKTIPASAFATDLTAGVAAKTASLSAYICTGGNAFGTPGDIDWFVFSNTNGISTGPPGSPPPPSLAGYPDVEIKLTNLFGDYNVELYNASGVRIGHSTTHTGSVSDTVIFHPCFGATGTYYIKVFGVGGTFFPTFPYKLSVTLKAVSYSCHIFSRMAGEGSESEGENKLLIAPNPSEGKFRISNEKGISSLRISDLTGKVLMVQETEAGSTEYELDMTTFAEGLYFMAVTNAFGTVTEKILKN
jgi:hypothetical protein